MTLVLQLFGARSNDYPALSLASSGQVPSSYFRVDSKFAEFLKAMFGWRESQANVGMFSELHIRFYQVQGSQTFFLGLGLGSHGNEA